MYKVWYVFPDARNNMTKYFFTKYKFMLFKQTIPGYTKMYPEVDVLAYKLSWRGWQVEGYY